MVHWIHDFNKIEVKESEMGQHILFIVGPTGAGKTYLAELLCTASNKFVVVPNHTTRDRRDSDINGHFRYLNTEQFNYLLKKEKFFLARKSPNPLYGYLKEDINSIFKKNSIAIFMFRYSGLQYLFPLIKNFNTVFLTSNSETICKMSKDEFELPCVSEIDMNLKDNEILYIKIKERNVNTFVYENDFKFSLKEARDKILDTLIS